MIHERLIQRITTLLVRACDPEVIVLFGSYAKGQHNINSDLDILVVGDFHASSAAMERELRQLVHNLPIRVDLHVASPLEIQGNSKRFGFFSSILASGVRLYTTNGATQSSCCGPAQCATFPAFGKT